MHARYVVPRLSCLVASLGYKHTYNNYFYICVLRIKFGGELICHPFFLFVFSTVKKIYNELMMFIFLCSLKGAHVEFVSYFVHVYKLITLIFYIV